jgi:hypothetical protein
VRRARVLVRCMEFVYRDHGQDEWSAFGFANMDKTGRKIERLVTMTVRFSFFLYSSLPVVILLNLCHINLRTLGRIQC